jgi:predicted GIY-YIG superfamily endonuclease
MLETPERTALEDLYGTSEAEGVPAFLQQLYPRFLRFWQYLGTGTRHCQWDGPGYNYAPAEDEDSPLNYGLEVRWPVISAEAPEARVALYRLRDEAGRLLYVGISDAPLRRWPEHAADKPWWPDVTDFSLQWLDNRADALDAESRTIRTEKPLHNLLHNKAS